MEDLSITGTKRDTPCMYLKIVLNIITTNLVPPNFTYREYFSAVRTLHGYDTREDMTSLLALLL